jgi:N4-gp56 family major capsid protein
MAILTATQLANSVQTKYQQDYLISAKTQLYYDQLTYVVAKDKLLRGVSITQPFYFDLPPLNQAISQIADVNPQILYDKTWTVTPEMYGGTVQIAEKLRRTAYTDVEKVAAEMVGRQAGKTADFLARTAATQGTWVRYGGSATSRAGVDRVNDILTYQNFVDAAASLSFMGAEPLAGGYYVAVLDQPVFADLLKSGVILLIGEYQDKSILLRGELGMVGGVKLVVTNWAKKYFGAGASLASVSTTVATAINPGDKTITLASDTGVAIGQYLTVTNGGAIETGSVEYPMNEVVQVVGGTASPWQIVGSGVNGGFQFPHNVGELVKDNDTVHAVCFYGKNSIGKVYASDLGPMGKIMPPKNTGSLEQFQVIGWKGFFGYGRTSEARILRYEVAASTGN